MVCDRSVTHATVKSGSMKVDHFDQLSARSAVLTSMREVSHPQLAAMPAQLRLRLLLELFGNLLTRRGPQWMLSRSIGD